MTGPDDPTYPGQPQDPHGPGELPYPGATPYLGPADPPGAPPPPAGVALSIRLGERARRRPEPRLGISLAGIGVTLAIVGVIVWSGDFLFGGSGGNGGGDGLSIDDSRRLLGVGLSLAVLVVGYVLAIMRRSGPLTTAGVVASALATPVLFAFLTLDPSGLLSGGLPFSLDAIAIVSIIVWVVSYLLVPGAKGHAFYLTLAALTLAGYIVEKANSDLFSLRSVVSIDLPPDESGSGFSFGQRSSLTSLAVELLVIGLIYYAIAFQLDRTGRSGAAIAFAFAGFEVTAAGIATASTKIHQIGTGVLLIVLGLILAAYGARFGRRFTTWAWAFGILLGIVLIIARLIPDNDAAAGITLIVVGAVVVAGGHLLARTWNEPDDMASSPT